MDFSLFVNGESVSVGLRGRLSMRCYKWVKGALAIDDALQLPTKARQGLPKPILYRRFVFNTKLLGVVAELKVNHFNGD